jgi:uncharacterized integral membrane protein (TIGR00698 family)
MTRSVSTARSDPGSLAEDWWSVLIGLSLVIAALVLFHQGSSLGWLAVMPSPWSDVHVLLGQLAADTARYCALGGVLLISFTLAAQRMGQKPLRFAAGFVVVYLLSIVILSLGAWQTTQDISLETPIIALLAGLLLANSFLLPRWLEPGFRAEFFIKIGVVLLGGTLSIPLLRLASPIAIVQASIVSCITFTFIFSTARFLNLDRRLAAMLAGGGSICGISAVIAIASAVRARRDDISVATTIVVAWSLGMIVLLPLLARAWFLSAGAGGAWIGSSEFADAAGFAAAQTFGDMAETGTPDQALWAYTLVKVVGRDPWIGVWTAALSIIAITRWEPRDGGRGVDLLQVWVRFPKFIIGFLLAAVLVSWAAHGALEPSVPPRLVAPVDALRTWAFTFSFLSIGASMRLSRMAPISGNAFLAFSTGVVVNLVLGFMFSAVVFNAYWTGISR